MAFRVRRRPRPPGGGAGLGGTSDRRTLPPGAQWDHAARDTAPCGPGERPCPHALRPGGPGRGGGHPRRCRSGPAAARRRGARGPPRRCREGRRGRARGAAGRGPCRCPVPARREGRPPPAPACPAHPGPAGACAAVLGEDERIPERELNARLGERALDIPGVRRALVDEGIVAREADGSAYWRPGEG
ncbi:DUF2087 domain-containing protein [Sinomonas sp. RB5]